MTAARKSLVCSKCGLAKEEETKPEFSWHAYIMALEGSKWKEVKTP